MEKLFTKLGERFEGRQGGYTRVLKAGLRDFDSAPLAIIEWVQNDLPALRPKLEKKKNPIPKAAPSATPGERVCVCVCVCECV